MTAFILALAGFAAAAGGTLGHRRRLLTLGPTFLLFGAGLLASIAAALTATGRLVLMLVRHQPERMVMVVAALVISILVLSIPVSVIVTQRSSTGVPPIHDISTDTTDPPRFVDVLPLRATAPNTTEYGGAEIAAQQRRAYPDIVPLTLPLGANEAFDRALAVVEELGWDVAGSNRVEGRIEATDTRFWFGFKDDVVIRLRSAEGGTRIDVRSLSRGGGGDLGTNAKRIRAYLAG